LLPKCITINTKYIENIFLVQIAGDDYDKIDVNITGQFVS